MSFNRASYSEPWISYSTVFHIRFPYLSNRPFSHVMASLNPMEYTFSSSPAPHISKNDFAIAGIDTTVYGLAELPPSATDVAVLWLLHPRLQSSSCMEPVAAVAITAWNSRVKEGKLSTSDSNRGLIAVSIDLRNHGSRQVSARANEVWRTGNPNHAKDIFSICRAFCAQSTEMNANAKISVRWYNDGYIFVNRPSPILCLSRWPHKHYPASLSRRLPWRTYDMATSRP
jgi:hypothetical protein